MTLALDNNDYLSGSIALDMKSIDPPSKAALYLKALLKVATKASAKKPFDPYGFQLDSAAVSPQLLYRYRKLCHFAEGNQLPITLPHLLSFPLQLKIVTDSRFPTSLIGLVHTKNQISQYRPILNSEDIQIRCALTKTRHNDKGIEFDIETGVWASGELAWQSLSTNLAPHKANQRTNNKIRNKLSANTDGNNQLNWMLPKALGRQYAMLGGDFNPIHIHSSLARLMGFKGMLIHGMYNKARCIAELEKKGFDTRQTLQYECQFKTPAFLPSEVCLSWEKTEAGVELLLKNSLNNKPHLSGLISTLHET